MSSKGIVRLLSRILIAALVVVLLPSCLGRPKTRTVTTIDGQRIRIPNPAPVPWWPEYLFYYSNRPEHEKKFLEDADWIFVTNTREIDEMKSRSTNRKLVLISLGWANSYSVRWEDPRTPSWRAPKDTLDILGVHALWMEYQNRLRGVEWALHDTDGKLLSPNWRNYYTDDNPQFLWNFTVHCPKGVYGSSKGLTFIEWLYEEWVRKVEREKWRLGSLTAPDAIFFEWRHIPRNNDPCFDFENADPDLDGISERDSIRELSSPQMIVFYERVTDYCHNNGLPRLLVVGQHASYWSFLPTGLGPEWDARAEKVRWGIHGFKWEQSANTLMRPYIYQQCLSSQIKAEEKWDHFWTNERHNAALPAMERLLPFGPVKPLSMSYIEVWQDTTRANLNRRMIDFARHVCALTGMGLHIGAHSSTGNYLAAPEPIPGLDGRDIRGEPEERVYKAEARDFSYWTREYKGRGRRGSRQYVVVNPNAKLIILPNGTRMPGLTGTVVDGSVFK